MLTFLDMDSSITEVYGTGKEGAAYGHTKKLGLNILLTTLCTPVSAPVILATRLRGGNADTRRKARSHLRTAIGHARALGATRKLVVRMDSGYYVAALLHTVIQAGAYFSVTAPQRPDVVRAEKAIQDDHWQPLTTPTATLIQDVEIAETTITVFKNPTTQRGMKVTARLIVRRTPAPPERREINGQCHLFPKYHYHAVLTNLPTTQDSQGDPGFTTMTASYHHAARAGAIETVFGDLYAGPLAHLPSGRFHANAAWLTLATLTHNLLRALGALASPYYATARIATIRRHLITIAGRHTTSARHTTLRLPHDWPWQAAFQTIFTATHTPTTIPAPTIPAPTIPAPTAT